MFHLQPVSPPCELSFIINTRSIPHSSWDKGLSFPHFSFQYALPRCLFKHITWHSHTSRRKHKSKFLSCQKGSLRNKLLYLLSKMSIKTVNILCVRTLCPHSGPNCTVPVSEPGMWDSSATQNTNDDLGKMATAFIVVIAISATSIIIVLGVCYKRRCVCAPQIKGHA